MSVQCTPPCAFSVGSLIVSLLQFARNCRQIAEQASGLLVRAGGEVHLRHRRMGRIETARADISWRKRPDPLDGERLAVCILQQSVELACRNIVGGNEAGGLGVSGIGKLSDQQVMTKTPEVERSQSHTPRHIQPGAVFETPQKLATRAEDIDIA